MSNTGQFVLSTEIEDSDWSSLFAIMYKAFEHNPTISVMYPAGLDPAYRDEYANRFKGGWRIPLGSTVEKYIAKLTNRETGEIIAFVNGKVFKGKSGLLDSTDGKPLPPMRFPVIKDPKQREFFEYWWTSTRNAIWTKAEEMWVPNIYVQSLCTDPAWQRQGAGTRLMSWVVGFGRTRDVNRCSLQASISALEFGFHEKRGFRVSYREKIDDEVRFPGMHGGDLVIEIKDF